LFALIIVGIYYGFHSDVFSNNMAHAWGAKGVDSSGAFSSLSGMSLATALGLAMIGSLFSSDAWNNVTFIAGEVENPKRNIPLGLFFGVCIVTLIYVLANVAYLCLLPLDGSVNAQTVAEQGIMFAQKDRVGTAALFVVFGDIAKYLMAALIMVSTFGCNNGLILAGSRLFQSMAKDGLFFKSTAKLNKFNVPARAMTFQGIWASLLCLSGSYGDLLDYCTFSSLIFYIITIAGLFVLRKKMPDVERPYKAFGYPVIPALYIVLTTLICVDLLVYKTFNCGMGLLIIALGVPVYYMFKRTKHGVSEN
jgi:APA family basic amino acid/polyamine antiporter